MSVEGQSSPQGLGPVRRFSEIDSTNRYLADEARAGAPHGLVAVAEYQTAGRGRLGRRWDAPPGANLLFSVLLYPFADQDRGRDPDRARDPGHRSIDPVVSHLCSICVALAAADSCKQLAGVDPGLKWPNDLVVDDLKLAGVLAEVIGGTANGAALVVGLGLNVGWPPKHPAESERPAAPEESPGSGREVLQTATSLARLSDVAVDPAMLLAGLLDNLGRRLTELHGTEGRQLHGPAHVAVMDEYRSRCVTLGRHVRVDQSSGSFHGVAVEVTDEGHLVVESPSGRRVVMAGDVVHLRHEVETGR